MRSILADTKDLIAFETEPVLMPSLAAMVRIPGNAFPVL